ncbi:MAG: hypothetical protein IKO39_01350, partial [Treponema sp.]|nr:hypothetical protein [Treponema sp.]
IKIIKKRRIDNIFFKKNPDRRSGKSKERICLQILVRIQKSTEGFLVRRLRLKPSGYPQFRANRTPFLRYASEQPSRAAATIPSPLVSDTKLPACSSA